MIRVYVLYGRGLSVMMALLIIYGIV